MLARTARVGRGALREHDVLVHTHASESQDEVEVVRRLSGGRTNLKCLADPGLASDRSLRRTLCLGV